MLYLFSEEQFFIYFENIILKSWGIFDSSGASLGGRFRLPLPRKYLDEKLVGSG